MITPSAHRRHPLRFALTLVAAATLAACGGDSGDDAPDAAVDDVPGGVPVAGGDPAGSDGDDDDDVAAPPAGDIARYGVLNLGDENGEANELVAGFFALPTPVSPAAFGGALEPGVAACDVAPVDGGDGFAFPSGGFVPAPAGVPAASIESVGAGETLSLTSGGGTWAELQPAGAIGGVSFYAPTAMLPAGPVPEDLSLDVPGDEFPAFAGAALPDVTPLIGFTDDSDGAIGADTRFAWQAGSDPDAKVRLSTGSNFFSDPGTAVRVSCTVPDTGEFAFDADTRAALGDGFAGDMTAASRIAIGTVARDDALLILVRESDATSN